MTNILQWGNCLFQGEVAAAAAVEEEERRKQQAPKSVGSQTEDLPENCQSQGVQAVAATSCAAVQVKPSRRNFGNSFLQMIGNIDRLHLEVPLELLNLQYL